MILLDATRLDLYVFSCIRPLCFIQCCVSPRVQHTHTHTHTHTRILCGLTEWMAVTLCLPICLGSHQPMTNMSLSLACCSLAARKHVHIIDRPMLVTDVNVTFYAAISQSLT